MKSACFRSYSYYNGLFVFLIYIIMAVIQFTVRFIPLNTTLLFYQTFLIFICITMTANLSKSLRIVCFSVFNFRFLINIAMTVIQFTVRFIPLNTPLLFYQTFLIFICITMTANLSKSLRIVCFSVFN